MSTALLAQFDDGAILVPVEVHTKAYVAAWVSWKSSITLTTLESYNISSTTDQSTGIQTASYTNNMMASDYPVTVNGNDSDGSPSASNARLVAPFSRATNEVRSTTHNNQADQFFDADYVSHNIYGELA